MIVFTLIDTLCWHTQELVYAFQWTPLRSQFTMLSVSQQRIRSCSITCKRHSAYPYIGSCTDVRRTCTKSFSIVSFTQLKKKCCRMYPRIPTIGFSLYKNTDVLAAKYRCLHQSTKQTTNKWSEFWDTFYSTYRTSNDDKLSQQVKKKCLQMLVLSKTSPTHYWLIASACAVSCYGKSMAMATSMNNIWIIIHFVHS